ncbi:MAG: hypothetical protein KDK78_00300 [Chlamydiia bacterium]|nr:hypothetical protein [Chlamydiia bacterium]
MFERFIRDSWWVVVFTLATCMVFESGSHQLRREQQRLEGQRQALILDICRESDHRDALHRQIASKDDPAWMERVLIEDLGMVPDGYRKLTLPSTPMEAVPCL